MSAPTWAEPPPIGGPQDPRSIYVERLRPLVREPGRWALIKSGTPSSCSQTATKLRERQYHIPGGEWEFTVRTFRRGVHVGDMNTANIYARFVREWEPDEVHYRRYWHSKTTAYDADGRRVCPDCGTVLAYPDGGGSYASKCDACWEHIAEHGEGAQRKWARARKTRLAARGWLTRKKPVPMCIWTDCGADAKQKQNGWNVCDAHASRVFFDSWNAS